MCAQGMRPQRDPPVVRGGAKAAVQVMQPQAGGGESEQSEPSVRR